MIQSIYEGCGLRYAAIYRKPEALALFRANSTYLSTSKKRNKRGQHTGGVANPSQRDSLLNYQKSQLVAHLLTAQQQLLETQQQTMHVEASIKREARIAEADSRIDARSTSNSKTERKGLCLECSSSGHFGQLLGTL